MTRSLLLFLSLILCWPAQGVIYAQEGSPLPTGTDQAPQTQQSASQLLQAEQIAKNLVDSKNTLYQSSLIVSSTQVVSIFDSQGRLVRQDTYTDGKLVQSDYFNLNGIVYQRSVFTYDAQGKRVETDLYKASNAKTAAALPLLLVQSTRYTSSGKTASVDIFDPLSVTPTVPTQRYEYEYDSRGRLTKKTTYVQSSGVLGRLSVRSYDASGVEYEIDFYDPATDTLTKRFRYVSQVMAQFSQIDEYNSALVLVKSTHYDSQTGLRLRVFEYDAIGRVAKIETYSSAGALLQTYELSITADPSLIQLWFTNNQAANASTGLVATHPDNTSFIYHEGVQAPWAIIYAYTQAYTYDQATAGIALLEAGDTAAAKKIFDFYHAEWQREAANFSGFWTVYNVDANFQWKRYEWRKGLGENAWIALFAMRYYATSEDPAEKQKALDLSIAIARWIATLPHSGGAVAMSPFNAATNPNYGALYSTENNLDYYALLKGLQNKPLSSGDATLVANELAQLTAWLKNQAYDTSKGLFKRGGRLNASGVFEWDPLASLDVSSWAVSAIGIATLESDFGINIHNFMKNIQTAYAVQANNTFGGNIFTAKGFDFSDAANASQIGRAGVKWVEGTNQMILAYQLIADYYKDNDPFAAAYYRALVDYFLARNRENLITVNGAQSYTYADRANTQIYADSAGWRTFSGQAAPSVSWVYLALQAVNPFAI